MWIPYNLFSAALAVSYGSFLYSIQKDTELLNVQLQLVNGIPDKTIAMAQVQTDLKICMGDHYELLIRPNRPYRRGCDPRLHRRFPDFYAVESLKNMLDIGPSVAALSTINLKAGIIAASSNKTVSEDMHTTLKEIDDILSSTGEDWYWYANDDLGILGGYRNNRGKIGSLKSNWTGWLIDEEVDSGYKAFVDSCIQNDMSNWFLSVNTTMSKRYSKRYGFPEALLDDIDRRRSLFTMVVRSIKSDMCAAAFLLGACDKARNSSSRAANEHMDKVLEIYKQFAVRFSELDKDLVSKSRSDIALAINGYLNGLKYYLKTNSEYRVAEILAYRLGNWYYWLTFAVIIFQSENENGESAGFTEYPPGKQCPCVISADHTLATNETWKAIIMIARRTRDSAANSATWAAVSNAMTHCHPADSNCSAHKYFDVTSEMNVPMASYIATTKCFKDNHTYPLFGPEISSNGRNLETFNWRAIQPGRNPEIITVIAAPPCDLDIYAH